MAFLVGHSRVFTWSDTTWVQLGDDLEGENIEDYSGNAVAINASGDVVAIGATQNDGNGTSSGHVRLYQNNTCTSPVSITMLPAEDASFVYGATSFCFDSPDPSPVHSGTTGGYYLGDNALVIDTASGVVDLDSSGVGTYTVTYITSTGPCADTATYSFTIESCADNDGDGIPDHIDIDDDNDGITDIEEGACPPADTCFVDTDGDGVPDYFDIDSDNDGIFDVVEGGDGDQDTNGDGVIDRLETGFKDIENDGMADGTESTDPPDTDGDGIDDFLDIDSDNDGIFDVVEGGDGDIETNGDGVIDKNDKG